MFIKRFCYINLKDGFLSYILALRFLYTAVILYLVSLP